MNAIRELSLDRQMLTERLEKVAIGETVTYAELSEVIGREVRMCRHLLYGAMHTLQRDNHMIFDTVMNVGVKRQDDSGIVAGGDAYIRHIRRTSRTGARRLSCVDSFTDLPPDRQIQHNANMSLMGAFTSMTRRKKRKELESRVKEAQDKLSLAKTLELFQK